MNNKYYENLLEESDIDEGKKYELIIRLDEIYGKEKELASVKLANLNRLHRSYPDNIAILKEKIKACNTKKNLLRLKAYLLMEIEAALGEKNLIIQTELHSIKNQIDTINRKYSDFLTTEPKDGVPED